MYTFDWQIRSYLKEFNQESVSLPLLITFMLHADLNGQLYPSTEYLASELGTTERRIIDGRKWLLSRGAYIPVPYILRSDKLKDLPRRQFVYQLTGLYITSEKLVVPYLYMTPEGREEIRERIAPLIEVLKTVKTEVSDLEVFNLIAKGISIVKGGSKKDDARKRGSTPKTKKTRKRNAMFDAIVTAFGYDSEVTETKAALINKVASELAAVGITPDQVALIHAYCTRLAKQGNWKPFTPRILTSYADNWKASVRPTPPKPQPTNGYTPAPAALPDTPVYENGVYVGMWSQVYGKGGE